MSELNLTQRADLKNSTRFQNRLHAAATKTAQYWKAFPITTFEGYNEATRKRKELASRILERGIVSSGYIADFVSSYNNSTPILENEGVFDAETNQLADNELADSPTSASVFDRQAGVLSGDDLKQISL